MLIKLSPSVDIRPTIRKTANGKDASLRGAFPCGTVIEFTVECPRVLGASAVVLRIARDGEPYFDMPLDFYGTSQGTDEYRLELDTERLCENGGCGLFYYEFLFLRGLDTLFTDTYNFVDFELSKNSAGRFLLLVFKENYSTPEWFKGRIMYHIFVDRFFKGEGEVGTREDAIINEDWDGGLMQFPEKNGDKLSNNMFFGGTLWGVVQKLDYLKSLGVGVIYLSPIFEAYSNHKYDTGDYLRVDEMFGGEAALKELLARAAELDIGVILDGVFNHTGDNSRYFDRYGKYGGNGAYTSLDSEYHSWYKFAEYPKRYETWWGIDILPKLNHSNEACRSFFTGEGGVGEKYIKMGIGGWRLDVADELSDKFLDEFRSTVKQASDGQGIIIGEVWENAAEKIAYSNRRRYFQGDQLDSVMNYPLRNGILSLITDRDASLLCDVLKSIYASYPKCVCDCLMNLLGTHDTQRILTVIGEAENDISELSNAELSVRTLDANSRARAIKLQKLAATVQYTVYGVPSVFYGDEVGVEGYHDPFCRKTFPWGRECQELLEFYRALGKIRTDNSVFVKGDFCVDHCEGGVIVYRRSDDFQTVTVAVNAGLEAESYPLDNKKDLLTGRTYDGIVYPESAVILV